MCSKNCLSCDTSPQHCTECPPRKALTNENTCKSCLDTGCNAGSFCDAGSGACQACHASCKTCSGAGVQACVTCHSDSFLAAGGVCGECSAECASCEGRGDVCTACPDGKVLDGGKCVGCRSSENCGRNSFCNSSQECERCSDNCATCMGTNSTCITCYPGFHLSHAGPTCISCTDGSEHCADNEFCADNGACTDCHPSCATCSGIQETQCLTCPDGSTLAHDGTCVPCEPACKSCMAGNPGACTECADPLLHLGVDTHECVECLDNSHCNQGSMCNTTKRVCEACTAPCAKCSEAVDKCDACVAGMQLDVKRHKCTTCSETGCPDSQFCDIPSGACKVCHPSCLTCTGEVASQCQTCADQTYLTASSGGNGWECKECSAPCRTCKGANNKCVSCIDGYYLTPDGSCLDQEPDPRPVSTDPFANPLVFRAAPMTTTSTTTTTIPALAQAPDGNTDPGDATQAMLQQKAQARILLQDPASDDTTISDDAQPEAAPVAPARVLVDGTVVVFDQAGAYQVQLLTQALPSNAMGDADQSKVYVSKSYFALMNTGGKYLQLRRGTVLALAGKTTPNQVKSDKSFWFKFADETGQDKQALTAVLDSPAVTIWPVQPLPTGSSLCVDGRFLKVCHTGSASVLSPVL
eukprot:GDKI01040936.1.p1 GENE.GDKI01040936.1~~GDKI01040936.1.p1  ORF type:complete len:639 (+),score=183.78 GDKI01040936.1:91-2007(+)